MRKRQRIFQVGCSLPFFIVLSLFGEIIHTDGNTYIFVHRFAHQAVHNELAELVAIVAVDGVCQTDNHFKIVHVDVPVRTIREQTERAVSVKLAFLLISEKVTKKCPAGYAVLMGSGAGAGKPFVEDANGDSCIWKVAFEVVPKVTYYELEFVKMVGLWRKSVTFAA